MYGLTARASMSLQQKKQEIRYLSLNNMTLNFIGPTLKSSKREKLMLSWVTSWVSSTLQASGATSVPLQYSGVHSVKLYYLWFRRVSMILFHFNFFLENCLFKWIVFVTASLSNMLSHTGSVIHNLMNFWT